MQAIIQFPAEYAGVPSYLQVLISSGIPSLQSRIKVLSPVLISAAAMVQH